MWHAMSMKDAVKQWEQQNQQKISSAIEIKLTGICPSLDKMDTIMLSFVACEKLSLSSNSIERIANLGSMKFLRILSLGRNNIKSISGIEAVSETLEELWISYNQIEKLKGIGSMKKLKVLTISNNNIREWVEFMRLSEMASLKELVFIGNPLEERCTSEGIWRSEVVRRLPNLAKLDGHQCMATEVNLSDTQTELQKDNEEEDEENQEDNKNPVEENGQKEMEGDEETNQDEETEDDDQLSQGNESNEENKEEVVNKADSAELEESGNPVRQLNQVNQVDPAVKEE